MKIAVASTNFVPDENFHNFLDKIDNITDVCSPEFMYNQSVVDYIEKNSNWAPYWRQEVVAIKGVNTFENRIGFKGIACVLEVDTSKSWIIRWDKGDVPYVFYVDFKVHKDEYNRVWVTKEII